jgi:hypothetical protein
MGWLITLFELIRDRFEEWQLNIRKRELEHLQLTVPGEVEIAKLEIKTLNAETKAYNAQAENERLKTRVVNASRRVARAS